MEIFLGIDTSCYTTSLAVMDKEGRLLAEARRPLTVKEGGRGLAQRDMVFQHVKNLPLLAEELLEGKDYLLLAAGVSAKPRPSAESYMPAFLPGLSLGRSLAAACGCPLYTLSHQEGHVAAVLWHLGDSFKAEKFLALHISGGTTDLLLATAGDDGTHALTLLGGSSDLQAGQFVDRVGQALGLGFPAGLALEALARTAAAPLELPVAYSGYHISLAGPCTAALRALAKGAEPAALALGVERVLALSLGRLIRRAAADHGCKELLLVGGVAGNLYIREEMEKLLRPRGITLHTAPPLFSRDNAVGCAAMARARYLFQKEQEHG